MRYVSLHHHSTFSYGDGFGTPEQHVARAVELGYKAMALTEHGNVSSHVQLEKAAVKAGIKPIFGLEAYTAPVDMREQKNTRKWHLTLLASDAVGYRNLMKLCTLSWSEGFYRWPTITGPMLAEYAEGIICLSGCSDSLLACSLLGGKGIEPVDASEARAHNVIESFKELFGDRYYLEVQQFPELERTHAINRWYAAASRIHGVPLAASSDVHYPNPDDNEMQVILHAASRDKGTVAAAEASWEYNIRLTLPTSDRQILERLQETGLTKREAQAAILSTEDIAERCNVELPKADRLRYPGTVAELKWS
jgi:DNA polymerase-3 subunit alpha